MFPIQTSDKCEIAWTTFCTSFLSHFFVYYDARLYSFLASMDEFCGAIAGLGGCAPLLGQNGGTTAAQGGLGSCLPGAPTGALDPCSPLHQATTGCVSGVDSAVGSLAGSAVKTKKIMYDVLDNEEFDREEIPTYEEVARLFPRPGVFRPIVLIGPPGVGRNELKRRIMALEPERYKPTIPRKFFIFIIFQNEILVYYLE